ncbi:lysophospholipid acyltransferase family protein [Flammeovirgaceae bacterium SG7u.111]|nr:lysophospholipid acyltransferase family protein [Flammeovirgaceae bacterium SG7u.132]WPO37268.1 lysophospholipid acyltransferase family protein [Flammeovirgaceae bacterium SG7u.111]
MKTIKYAPIYLVSFLPLSVLYVFSDMLYFMAYYILKYRREVVNENLKDSFPEKNEGELKLIEKKFYKHFCDVLFEALKTLTISKKEIQKRVQLKNPELIDYYYKSKQNMLLYAAHFGNWEWQALFPLFLNDKLQLTTFYQQLSNKYFDELMVKIRSRFGVMCVESKQGYKTLLRLTQQNVVSLSCMIGDQSPGRNSAMHWTSFLNRETAFLVGPDRMAKKSRQVTIFPAFRKVRRGCYEVFFKIVEDFSEPTKGEEIIDKYARVLEESIKESPELWLWSHKRWKLQRS